MPWMRVNDRAPDDFGESTASLRKVSDEFVISIENQKAIEFIHELNQLIDKFNIDIHAVDSLEGMNLGGKSMALGSNLLAALRDATRHGKTKFHFQITTLRQMPRTKFGKS
ncbi:hypothetical protein HMPREF2943_02960 [Corynebacterium sp. HMSC072D12]|uniref:hypothetical protein n=1 Tax=Corynebacterium sp. HMSC072D12 TaxID=1739447 RepID=UPI0008A55346|nr:hypothetical protein [Corynebacterium sp. HMSC072D12]OFQ33988.1 hypothetical protein HMPREF2943_02960 [Corynebacterium sp. HMSC072D12]